MIEPARNVCTRSPEECTSGPLPKKTQVSLLHALMAVSYPRSPQVEALTVPTRPLCQRKHTLFGQPSPMSSVTAGPRPASTLQITLQTLVSCKTAVSHAWLILPTSPAGCGHMSSPAGTFCPAPPRISSLRGSRFRSTTESSRVERENSKSSRWFWSQPSVVAAVVTGAWSAASAIWDMLSRPEGRNNFGH